MKRGTWFARFADWIFLIPFLMLFWSIQTAEAMVVWTDHATVKIRKEITLTAPKANQTAATLKAAKNEFEAFQLIVTADQDNLSGVNVSVSDLTGPNGNKISSSAIMIYKEAFMNITTLSNTDGLTGYWPDALIPKKDEYVGEVRNAFPFSVTLGRNQPVWIEIYVPATAAAGLYIGTATVTATNQTAVAIPVELTVWNFTLPSTSTLKSAFSIDFKNLPMGHGYGSDHYFNHLDLIKVYSKANLLHRITPDYLPGPHVVPGGWDAFTTRFGPLFDGTEPLPGGKLPGAKMTAYRISTWDKWTDQVFLKDLALRLKARNWFGKAFQYTFDEPQPDQPAQWQTIKDRVTALHRADPGFKTLVTTSIQSATEFGLTQCGAPKKDPCIDILTPTIRFMDNKPGDSVSGGEVPGGNDTIGNQRDKYGPETWWYQACGSHGCSVVGTGYRTGWPTYMIDLPALFSRVMEWQSFKYNIQGELYYDVTFAYQVQDPWVSQHDFGGNGDGTLYYPGTPAKIGGTKHIPVESIRLKMIREGMEDYEYMHLLKELGEEAYAQEQVATVVTNTYTWSRSPEDFYAARERMALKIQSHADPTPIPEPIPDPDPDPINTLPTAVMAATPDNTDPLLVHFNGADSHAAEGAIAAYEWDFGDNTTATGATVEHQYKAPGKYEVKLTVTDEKGKSATAAFPIQAGEPGSVLGPSTPSGGGGGCGIIQTSGPTDYRQAIPYLLIFFAPFWRTIFSKIRQRVS